MTSTRDKHGKRKAQVSRSIHYEIEGDLQGTNVDRILEAALKDGLVTVYDVARQCTWFEGAPGQELRDLRAKIQKIAYTL